MEQWHSHLLRERVDQSSLLIQGNRACALGALDAGVRFFAGYPISPSSEIMEAMADELPRVRRGLHADGGRDRAPSAPASGRR